MVVIGLLTDQCIDHTVKDAADRGYKETCIMEPHQAALGCLRGCAAQITVDSFAATLTP